MTSNCSYQGSQSHDEGRDGPEAHALGSKVGDDAGKDGQDAVPEGRDWEGDPDPLGGEAVALRVLVHIPEWIQMIQKNIQIFFWYLSWANISSNDFGLFIEAPIFRFTWTNTGCLVYPYTLYVWMDSCCLFKFNLPWLKCWEEHGCCDPPEDPAHEEPPVVGGQLGEAAEGVDDGEAQRHLAAPPEVSQRPRARPEQHWGGEPDHVEHRDLRLLEAVVGVQLVDVGALQPVPQQRGEVDQVKTPLETEMTES